MRMIKLKGILYSIIVLVGVAAIFNNVVPLDKVKKDLKKYEEEFGWVMIWRLLERTDNLQFDVKYGKVVYYSDKLYNFGNDECVESSLLMLYGYNNATYTLDTLVTCYEQLNQLGYGSGYFESIGEHTNQLGDEIDGAYKLIQIKDNSIEILLEYRTKDSRPKWSYMISNNQWNEVNSFLGDTIFKSVRVKDHVWKNDKLVGTILIVEDGVFKDTLEIKKIHYNTSERKIMY